MSEWYKYNYETKQVEPVIIENMPLTVKRRLFIPEFTLGHVFQLLSMMVTVIALWFKTDNRITRLEDMMQNHDKMIQSVVVNQAALIKSLAVLEERTSRNAK